jgi:hypothetical protein
LRIGPIRWRGKHLDMCCTQPRAQDVNECSSSCARRRQSRQLGREALLSTYRINEHDVAVQGIEEGRALLLDALAQHVPCAKPPQLSVVL